MSRAADHGRQRAGSRAEAGDGGARTGLTAGARPDGVRFRFARRGDIDPDHASGIPDHHGPRGDRLGDDRERADPRVIAHADVTDHRAARPEVHAVADDRHPEIVARPVRLIPDRDAVPQMAATAENAMRVEHDPVPVI